MSGTKSSEMPVAPRGAGTRKNRAPAERHGDGKDAGDPRNMVNSLAKGLRVLEAFTAQKAEMSLTEIAAAAQIDPGTAYRMLNTLMVLGYVNRIPDSRRFRLSLKVVDLGLRAIGHSDLREIARPILRSLVGEVSEAASLGVLDGADVLYIERVRAGLTRLGVDIRIGTTVPALCSAIGQSMIAFLPDKDLDRILALTPRADGIPPVHLGKQDLERDLQEVRELGYALRDSYLRDGLRVLACPVLDTDGYPVAAVSVVAPAIRLSKAELCSHALEPLSAAAGEIARAVLASGTISTTA